MKIRAPLGPGRVVEKDVVMKIARRLEQKLERAEGYQPGDDPHRRTTTSRTASGWSGPGRLRRTWFVSIHADAFKIPSVDGASVYTLSDRGASSETARWLAASENASDLIGGVPEEVVTP